MIIVGIDPGAHGGLCAMSSEGEILYLEPMPYCSLAHQVDGASIFSRFATAEKYHFYIEHSQAIPGHPSTVAAFSFGQNFGVVLGVVQCLRKPYTLVKPRVWQAVQHLGLSSDLEAKERSLIAASRLFPTIDFRANDRCRKAHDGLVDAALIADWGRRILG